MGCWGITASNLDDGLGTVNFIRNYLSRDGKLNSKKCGSESP